MGTHYTGTTFIYDIENWLVSLSGAIKARLRYDPLGRIYFVVGGSNTTRFFYDRDGLIAEYEDSGAIQHGYPLNVEGQTLSTPHGNPGYPPSGCVAAQLQHHVDCHAHIGEDILALER